MFHESIITVPATRGSAAAVLAAMKPPMLWPATMIRLGSMWYLAILAGSSSQATAASPSARAFSKLNLPWLPHEPR